jgi:hypothetical protein
MYKYHKTSANGTSKKSERLERTKVRAAPGEILLHITLPPNKPTHSLFVLTPESAHKAEEIAKVVSPYLGRKSRCLALVFLLGIDRSRVNNIRVDWVVYIRQAISAAAWILHAANHGNARLHTHLFLSNGCVVSWLESADLNVLVFIGREPLFLSPSSCRDATSLEGIPHGTPEFLDFSRALKRAFATCIFDLLRVAFRQWLQGHYDVCGSDRRH